MNAYRDAKALRELYAVCCAERLSLEDTLREVVREREELRRELAAVPAPSDTGELGDMSERELTRQVRDLAETGTSDPRLADILRRLEALEATDTGDLRKAAQDDWTIRDGLPQEVLRVSPDKQSVTFSAVTITAQRAVEICDALRHALARSGSPSGSERAAE